MSRSTPWGQSDSEEILISGIMTVYHTPSHGGVYVKPRWNVQIPQDIRDAAVYGGGNQGWYEQDCEWVLPHLWFWDKLYAQHPVKATEARLQLCLARCQAEYQQLYVKYFRRKYDAR